jgi:hypothetical protein
MLCNAMFDRNMDKANYSISEDCCSLRQIVLTSGLGSCKVVVAHKRSQFDPAY